MKLGFQFAMLAALTAFSAHPQDAQPSSAFEAASVKRSDPTRTNIPPNVCRGGPGTFDPTLLTCANSALGILITIAYDLQFYQLISPDWVKMGGGLNGYDLSAKIPANTTKEDFRLMLRNLLAERFHLQVRRETRRWPHFALVTSRESSKASSKLQDAVPHPSGGRPSTMTIPNGHIHFVAEHVSMKAFTGFLTTMLSGPVADHTNLSGEYAFTLDFTPDDRWPGYSPAFTASQHGNPAPSLFTAIQELGLKVESSTAPLEFVVIDHADRIPVEN
jgi:uncharacterized protein (TIGR03435 family)